MTNFEEPSTPRIMKVKVSGPGRTDYAKPTALGQVLWFRDSGAGLRRFRAEGLRVWCLGATG